MHLHKYTVILNNTANALSGQEVAEILKGWGKAHTAGQFLPHPAQILPVNMECSGQVWPPINTALQRPFMVFQPNYVPLSLQRHTKDMANTDSQFTFI